MEQGIIIVCLVLIVVAALACAMFRSLLKSAITLACISALLSIILFIVGATWAALFELSVCAGLVTVIFVSAISLTYSSRSSHEEAKQHYKHFAALPFILIFTGIALVSVMMVTGFDITPIAAPTSIVTFKEAFWNMRQADVLGQVIIILAGAFAVVILFKESDKA